MLENDNASTTLLGATADLASDEQDWLRLQERDVQRELRKWALNHAIAVSGHNDIKFVKKFAQDLVDFVISEQSDQADA